MNNIFVIILVIILVVIYLGFDCSKTKSSVEKERFIMIDSNIYSNVSTRENPYSRYIMPPLPTEPDVDYQAYLNTVSGYNSASRSYNNPFYAQSIARGLDN
jgi:hypothetical protein